MSAGESDHSLLKVQMLVLKLNVGSLRYCRSRRWNDWLMVRCSSSYYHVHVLNMTRHVGRPYAVVRRYGAGQSSCKEAAISLIVPMGAMTMPNIMTLYTTS
jgi:hypothetical protein